MTDRATHIAWCKQRALIYCDTGNHLDAFASLLSDLDKHEETRTHLG